MTERVFFLSSSFHFFSPFRRHSSIASKQNRLFPPLRSLSSPISSPSSDARDLSAAHREDLKAKKRTLAHSDTKTLKEQNDQVHLGEKKREQPQVFVPLRSHLSAAPALALAAARRLAADSPALWTRARSGLLGCPGLPGVWPC